MCDEYTQMFESIWSNSNTIAAESWYFVFTENANVRDINCAHILLFNGTHLVVFLFLW